MSDRTKTRLYTTTAVAIFAVAAAPSLVSCGSKNTDTGFSGGVGGSGSGVTSSGVGFNTGSGASMTTITVGSGVGGGGGPLPPGFVPTEFGGYALGPAITNGDGGAPGATGSAASSTSASSAGSGGTSSGGAGSGGSGGGGAGSGGSTTGGATASSASGSGAGGSSTGQNCRLITGVARDFQFASVMPGGHPDFEVFAGNAPTLHLVADAIGKDQKPVYASKCEATLVGGDSGCPFGQQTTSKTNYDEWYRFTDGINKPYLVYFEFVPNGNVFTFQSGHYFPLDNAGWGNSGMGDDGKEHNFSFTTEIHTSFLYKGGEQFTFIGDDDVWVFMNGKLGIDLGGLHSTQNGTIDLDQSADTLGLVKGQQYSLDVFQAERHTAGSTFRIDTNLAFTNCGVVVPDMPPPQ